MQTGRGELQYFSTENSCLLGHIWHQLNSERKAEKAVKTDKTNVSVSHVSFFSLLLQSPLCWKRNGSSRSPALSSPTASRAASTQSLNCAYNWSRLKTEKLKDAGLFFSSCPARLSAVLLLEDRHSSPLCPWRGCDFSGLIWNSRFSGLKMRGGHELPKWRGFDNIYGLKCVTIFFLLCKYPQGCLFAQFHTLVGEWGEGSSAFCIFSCLFLSFANHMRALEQHTESIPAVDAVL